MDNVSVEEKIEIILIYGECRRNVNDTVGLYTERFPNKVQSHAFFSVLSNSLLTEGSVQPKKRTRMASVTRENEIAILAVVNNNHISTREIARDSTLLRTSVCKILKRHKYRPYHVSMHQELHGDDFHNQVTFC
ncbi:hypothetical protein EAI_06541, partial [Harpegnathos saltator]